LTVVRRNINDERVVVIRLNEIAQRATGVARGVKPLRHHQASSKNVYENVAYYGNVYEIVT
jgi:hypothetical protein